MDIYIYIYNIYRRFENELHDRDKQVEENRKKYKALIEEYDFLEEIEELRTDRDHNSNPKEEHHGVLGDITKKEEAENKQKKHKRNKTGEIEEVSSEEEEERVVSSGDEGNNNNNNNNNINNINNTPATTPNIPNIPKEEEGNTHHTRSKRRRGFDVQYYTQVMGVETEYEEEELGELLNIRDSIMYEFTIMKDNLKLLRPNIEAIQMYKNKALEMKRKEGESELTRLQFDKAKEELERLKRERTDKFMEGFTTINMRLKEMYQMITLGGDAELELNDSLDPFNEGILFSVRPLKKSWSKGIYILYIYSIYIYIYVYIYIYIYTIYIYIYTIYIHYIYTIYIHYIYIF